MAYDMPAVLNASANSPLPSVLHGLNVYKLLGIPLSQLDVAFPWYGYDVVCDDAQAQADCFPMPSFPHRQLGLGQILDLYAAVGAPRIHVTFADVIWPTDAQAQAMQCTKRITRVRRLVRVLN